MGRPPNRILWDTVNERTVRIQLECILVLVIILVTGRIPVRVNTAVRCCYAIFKHLWTKCILIDMRL